MVDCHVCAIIVQWVSSPTISTTLLTLKANNVDCVCHHSHRLYSCHLYMSRCRHRRCRHRRHCRRHHCCSLNSFVGGAMIHALPIMLRYPSCQYPPLRCRFQVDGSPHSSPSHWTTTGRSFNYYDCPQLCQHDHRSAPHLAMPQVLFCSSNWHIWK